MVSKVRLGKGMKISTALVSVLVLVAIIAICCAALQSNLWYLIIVAIVLLASMAACPLMLPRKLELTGDALIIHFPLHKKQLPIANIYSVEKSAGMGGIRLFGAGGFFGNLGKFYNNSVGNYTAFVGDTGKAFYLRMKTGKAYMLSCDDRDAFCQRLSELITTK